MISLVSLGDLAPAGLRRVAEMTAGLPKGETAFQHAVVQGDNILGIVSHSCELSQGPEVFHRVRVYSPQYDSAPWTELTGVTGGHEATITDISADRISGAGFEIVSNPTPYPPSVHAAADLFEREAHGASQVIYEPMAGDTFAPQVLTRTRGFVDVASQGEEPNLVKPLVINAGK